MLDEFKKQTNVDVDLKIYPYETATERLNLDLNSGDYADVIGGWTLSDNAILTYGVNQGVFIPPDAGFPPQLRFPTHTRLHQNARRWFGFAAYRWWTG